MTVFLSTRSSSTRRPGSRWGAARDSHFTPRFIHETFGMTNPSIFRKLLGDKVGDHDIHALLRSQGVVLSRRRARQDPVDGRRPRSSRRPDGPGVKLAIGSSGVLPNLELTVSECGLTGRFAAIASLEDITHGKPDPRGLPGRGEKGGCEPSALGRL